MLDLSTTKPVILLSAAMPRDVPRTSTALDAAALGRLRELDPDGSRGLLPRILSVYETSLVRAIGQLRGGTGAGRARLICELAHTLKSSSASVGATALSELCAQIEACLRPRIDAEAPVQVGEAELDEHSDRLLAAGESALATVRSMLRG